MSKKYLAVLYDMDGLLIDTLGGFRVCDTTFFSKRGIVYDEEEVEQHLKGNSMYHGTAWIRERFHIQEPFEQLLQERLQLSNYMFDTVPLKPGAQELVEATKQSYLKTAIASGNTKDRINRIVSRFIWDNHFDALISSDDVGYKGKPAPDIFLHAANILGIDPSQCLVLEDAMNGVRAAKTAGMSCIAVRERNEEYLDDADMIVDSLHDPRIYAWLGIEKNNGI